jgi:hypothetical protein
MIHRVQTGSHTETTGNHQLLTGRSDDAFYVPPITEHIWLLQPLHCECLWRQW